MIGSQGRNEIPNSLSFNTMNETVVLEFHNRDHKKHVLEFHNREVQEGLTVLIQQYSFKIVAVLHNSLKNQEQLWAVESFQKFIIPYLCYKISTQIESSEFQIFGNMLSLKRMFSNRKISERKAPLVLGSVI